MTTVTRTPPKTRSRVKMADPTLRDKMAETDAEEEEAMADLTSPGKMAAAKMTDPGLRNKMAANNMAADKMADSVRMADRRGCVMRRDDRYKDDDEYYASSEEEMTERGYEVDFDDLDDGNEVSDIETADTVSITSSLENFDDYNYEERIPERNKF